MPDALVVPGRLYGPDAGMMMYAGDVAQRRGGTVHRHNWSAAPPGPEEPGIEEWVGREVTRALDAIGGNPLLIGKSLASHAAAVVAARSVPAVWLTPLLHIRSVPAALGRATAPLLLIGGTADSAWDGTTARRLSRHVLEIANADHGMYVPGPLTASIDVLGRMVRGIEEFLDSIKWPG